MARLRISYSKNGSLRYTGSLDVQKIWERVIRRAGLPIAYSQGFHPQAHINQAIPLPLGYTGANEIVDVWFVEEVNLQIALECIRGACPQGLNVNEITCIPEDASKLQGRVYAGILTSE